MASSSNSPCAACKFLRRKCTTECVFAPYFPPDQPQKFANVHKIFGASNVTKLLNELHPHQREDAVNSLAYEADARVKDPVYGCVGAISILQHQVKQLQSDLQNARSELSKYINAGIAVPPIAVPSSTLGIGMGTSREHIFREHIMEPHISRDHMLRNYDHEIARMSGTYDPNYGPLSVSAGGLGPLNPYPLSSRTGGDDRANIGPSYLHSGWRRFLNSFKTTHTRDKELCRRIDHRSPFQRYSGILVFHSLSKLTPTIPSLKTLNSSTGASNIVGELN